MLKVITILVDEVPNQGVNIVFCPRQPVLYRGLNVPNRPTVKFSRVHLIDLVLLTVLTAIDGSKYDRISMKVVPVELSAVRQLKDTLANFQGGTVNFVQEENNGLFTSLLEPIWGIEAGTVAFNARQANQVTLGHLAGTTLHYWKLHALSNLVNNLALTHTVATTKQDRQASGRYRRR